MKKWSLLSIALTSLGFLSVVPSAVAAEQVMLRYRGLSRTVAVADLAILADTGQVPDRLSGILTQTGQSPETVKAALNHPLEADVVTLDKALNSLPGEWVLDQISQAIRPVSGEASRQALRAALVLAASDDSEVTLLEVLQAYPTETVVVEVDQLQATYERIATFLEPISRVFNGNLLEMILRGEF